MRASEKALEELHAEIAITLKEQIAAYRNGEFKDREDNPLPVPSALLAASIKFLKDNQIDRPENEEPDPEDLLSDELPSFGEEPHV